MPADGDGDLQLSASTLAALMEFKHEEEQHLEEFRRLYDSAEEQSKDTADKNDAVAERGMNLFREDWQLSQFWYSDKTSNLLAEELLDGADEDTVICVVSAPSAYAAIKKRDPSTLPTKKIYLLEFDKRFKLLAGDKFVYYDYNNPLEIIPDLKGKVHRILIDPPFLQEDCQGKFAQTVHAILSQDRSSKTQSGALKYRFVAITGERMRDIVRDLYPGVKPTTYLPEHEGLSNEFLCYASYEGKNWKFAQEE